MFRISRKRTESISVGSGRLGKSSFAFWYICLKIWIQHLNPWCHFPLKTSTRLMLIWFERWAKRVVIIPVFSWQAVAPPWSWPGWSGYWRCMNEGMWENCRWAMSMAGKVVHTCKSLSFICPFLNLGWNMIWWCSLDSGPLFLKVHKKDSIICICINYAGYIIRVKHWIIQTVNNPEKSGQTFLGNKPKCHLHVHEIFDLTCQISAPQKSRLNPPVVLSYPPYQHNLYPYVQQINVTQEPLLIGWECVLRQTRVKSYSRVEPTAGRRHLHNSKTETQINKVKNTRDCKQGTAWTQLSLSKTRPLDKDNISG